MFLLDEVFRKYKIFIDTSAFMYIGAQDVFTKLFPRYLSDYSTNVIVPIRVIEELKKYQRSLDKADVARKALSVISEYQKFNFVDIRGEESDSFTDNLFQTIFTKFRIKYNLCLITQDKRLAIDIYNLRKSKSVFTDKDILVLYIFHNNVLKDWKEQLEHEVFKPSSEFNIPVKTNNIINISKIPTTDDTVLVGNDYNKVRLIKEIGKGGEGNIYLTDNNCCCKIYKKEKLTQEKYNKLILMLSKPLRKKGICWPKALVFNERKEFTGYFMDKAEGRPMQTSIFIKPNLERCFPEWNRINLINLCITILVKITELHRRNIIVGDINGLNILVKDDLNVYFVDTDSYQVEQYPCPVGTVNFTAPEIQELSYENFFRTKQHEYFALATLIFMILLPGKPPYSHRGGSTPFTGIKSGNFSYPLGEWNTDSTPMGPWRFIWSNLPYHLKEAFTNIFRKKEKRIGAEEWIAVMKRYKNDLKKGFMGIYGDNPFPPYFKITDRVDITCSMCNKQLVRDRKEIDGLTKRRQNVLCSDCREVIHETSNNQSELI